MLDINSDTIISKLHIKKDKKFCKIMKVKCGGNCYCCILCRRRFLYYSHYHKHICNPKAKERVIQKTPIKK